jgi:putative heme-binding domain-containing protein
VLENRNLENGRNMFALTQCYKCHRFEGEGGFVGPDLTGIGRRYSREDLLSSLVEPNKAVSDQYRSTRFTLTDGRTVTGRVVNLSGDSFLVQTDMMNPSMLTQVNVNDIDEQRPSTTSMMPEGLLDTLTKDEIYDLMAYLRSSQNLPSEGR